MKLKRVLAVLLALCMLLPLAACGGNDTTTTTAGGDTAITTTVVDAADDTPAPTDENGDEVTTTVATDENGNEVTTTVATNENGEQVVTTVADGGAVQVTTKKENGTTARTTADKGQIAINKKTTSTMGKVTFDQVVLKEGTKKMDDGLNFGGKTFTHAKNGATVSATSDYGQWCAAFEKAYNCKLEVFGLAMSEYQAGVAARAAGGQPYDIIFLYDSNFPSMIVANLMEPLENYFTTADLWDNKSKNEGGLSYSLSNDLSLNGHVYAVGGTYLTTPGCIWYNKKMFADAGYDGKNDPMALYKAGKWSWEKLYEILSDIQNPDAGLYGLNSISPYYSHMMFASYATGLAKKTSSAVKENTTDPQLYNCLEMMKKLNYGKQSVCDPKNQYEDGMAQFLNGTTAAWMNYTGGAWDLYKAMDSKTYSAFGTKAQQKQNVGMVPLPVANDKGIHAIWAWMGYGAGKGVSEDARKAAVAFAINDSKLNHKNVYHPEMPAEILKTAQAMADSDKLMAPPSGFKSSAGSLGSLNTSVCSAVANKGQSIAVVLKGNQKLITTVIEQALKGSQG